MAKTRINGQSLKRRLQMLHEIFVKDAGHITHNEYYFVVDNENAAHNAELDFMQMLDAFNLIGDVKRYTGGLAFQVIQTNGKLKNVELRCITNAMYLKHYNTYRAGNRTQVIYDVTDS